MSTLNLYHVAIPNTIRVGYDMYDSMVVCASSVDDARQIHPCDVYPITAWGYFGDWIRPEQISELIVEELGPALPSVQPGVILASFNAG